MRDKEKACFKVEVSSQSRFLLINGKSLRGSGIPLRYSKASCLVTPQVVIFERDRGDGDFGLSCTLASLNVCGR